VSGGFAYTYVLLCADRNLYIGSTDDLRRRLSQHTSGYVPATVPRRPVQLVYYEACLSLDAARTRERQLKTGYGRQYLKQRVTLPSHLPAVLAAEPPGTDAAGGR
jgi:putative endonuclease